MIMINIDSKTGTCDLVTASSFGNLIEATRNTRALWVLFVIIVIIPNNYTIFSYKLEGVFCILLDELISVISIDVNEIHFPIIRAIVKCGRISEYLLDFLLIGCSFEYRPNLEIWETPGFHAVFVDLHFFRV